ncbi:hypothetical protein [Arthrobacter sp. 18067]|uniref:hypothetical protein n=1 Tax=Arthrobacter sp. 18067 TaxID=2681413 RepID=UPI001F2725BE|nr:hypothetical protein [Arthrobacter sp. 18067]
MTTPELPGAGSQQPSPHPQHPQYAQGQPQYAQGPGVPPYIAQPTPTNTKKQLNVVGLIALVTAVLGFIFACVPGALIVGWVLLPIAFILAIVSLFLKDKAKWMGVAALIASVVGTIVGVIVFTAVVATSFDNAFGGDTKVVEPSKDGAVESGSKTDSSTNAGTRESPYPIGSVIESKDWRVVINSVTLAATDAVVAANQFNKAPSAGFEYILVNYTATYTGDDANGQMPVFVSVDYVTADGTTVDGTKSFAVAPEPIDNMSTLYKGATATGNKAFEVPSATAGQGVLAVRAGMFGDKVFVATK